MERRLAFVLGDLLANILVAAAATAATTWLMGGAWGMGAGAVLGMLLGGAIGLILAVGGLMPLLGALEVLSPCMLSGMLGGMWGGMWALAGAGILAWGAGTGLAVVAAIYGLNAVLTGPRHLEG